MVLTRALMPRPVAVWQETLLALPLATGAFRYARSGVRVTASPGEVGVLPGLGTIFFAFVSVTAVYLDAVPRLPIAAESRCPRIAADTA